MMNFTPTPSMLYDLLGQGASDHLIQLVEKTIPHPLHDPAVFLPYAIALVRTHQDDKLHQLCTFPSFHDDSPIPENVACITSWLLAFLSIETTPLNVVELSSLENVDLIINTLSDAHLARPEIVLYAFQVFGDHTIQLIARNMGATVAWLWYSRVVAFVDRLPKFALVTLRECFDADRALLRKTIPPFVVKDFGSVRIMAWYLIANQNFTSGSAQIDMDILWHHNPLDPYASLVKALFANTASALQEWRETYAEIVDPYTLTIALMAEYQLTHDPVPFLAASQERLLPIQDWVDRHFHFLQTV